MKKINILTLVTFLILMIFVPLMAQDVVDPGGDMSIENIIIYLTPFLVFGVGQLVKLVNKNIKGVWLLMLVAASSGVLAWITDLTSLPDLSWLLQFAYGMLSVVVHQFYKQLKSGN